jgi:DNA invertase Pin-like site-specific DNA recombinase
MSTARSETPKAAAVYCRISDDKTGAGLGVARQEETCRELAARLGWDVGRVYVDNDISAYRRKRRPQYTEMLGAIKRGEVDGLIAWHNDRLHRNPRELEDFIDLVEAAGIPVQTVSAGEYDLTTASGRMTARIIGAVARGESEHKAERQKAKHDELRAAGAPAGGARPFGLSPILRRPDGSGYREIVPAEAGACAARSGTSGNRSSSPGRSRPSGS